MSITVYNENLRTHEYPVKQKEQTELFSTTKPEKPFDSEEINQLVKTIVETANPLRIILFGSGARSEMRENSDLDVLVVVPEGTHPIRTAQKIHVKLLDTPLKRGVDVVVATENDLQKYGDNFSMVYYYAIREGKEIYAA